MITNNDVWYFRFVQDERFHEDVAGQKNGRRVFETRYP